MKSKGLIFIGGGGHCKSVIDVAECAGYNIIGILDMPDNIGKNVLNYQIIGTDDNIQQYADKYKFVVTIGQIKDVAPRIKVHNLIRKYGGGTSIIISPTAYVSKYAKISDGTVVMHHAVVSAGAKIGRGCIINSLSDIEHDVSIGEFCHISTGAHVNGNCIIGRGTFIGSQSVVSNGVEIAPGCVIGAGSLVRHNIMTSGVYYGKV